MEFSFTEEQRSLRAMTRAFARENFAETTVRALMDDPAGSDRSVWRRLGRDLGVLGLTLPAELGGGDAGAVELAIVAEELGRVLACTPFLSATLVGAALAHFPDDGAAREILTRLLEGEIVVALAASDDRGQWQPADATVAARRSRGGWMLAGSQSHVIDGERADAILVLAAVDGPEGPDGLFLVDGTASGLDRHALPTLDQTRRLARLDFDVPAVRVGSSGATVAVSAARDVGALLLAAEAAGATAHLVDMSVEYATSRLQFGRPIGSFQGVKHRCADMHIAAEQARSTAYHAAWAMDEGVDDGRLAVDLATVVTAGAYLDVVKNTVQVHGGIGFTWEHPAHLFYKRAVSDAALLGGRRQAADRLADLVLEDAS